MSDPVISFQNVSKWYGAFRALNDVNAVVERGQTVVLCGASGSGKSTLVRTVNRLEPIQQGRITVDGVDVGDKRLNINRFRQKIGFVFQQLNLFPHLNALDNVAMPLVRVLKTDKKLAREQARALLDRVGLGHRTQYRPADLSGGEEQRVAIARTLALDPAIILFDEPTSALDPERVGEVLEIMQTLVREGRTIMCVTHEMGFAQRAADMIWFMEQGAIVERAPPARFFSSPEHPSARSFLARILDH